MVFPRCWTIGSLRGTFTLVTISYVAFELQYFAGFGKFVFDVHFYFIELSFTVSGRFWFRAPLVFWCCICWTRFEVSFTYLMSVYRQTSS